MENPEYEKNFYTNLSTNYYDGKKPEKASTCYIDYKKQKERDNSMWASPDYSYDNLMIGM